MEKEIAKILLELNAVSLQPTKPFIWASGMKSPIYCDNRLIISDPTKRQVIVDAFVKVIKEKNLQFDIIGGTSTAGIPWAAWIAQKLEKPMIYIRSKPKDHGKENLIEGKLEKGQRVLVIEDLISTGGSSVGACTAVRDHGGIVNDCIAIFTYGFEKAKKAFTKANCQLYALSNFSALAHVASSNGYITEQEYQLILNWSSNPQNWSEKHNV